MDSQKRQCVYHRGGGRDDVAGRYDDDHGGAGGRGGDTLVVVAPVDAKASPAALKDLAAPGVARVALALQHRPDLILMDIQLPDIDGITALRRGRIKTSSNVIPSATIFPAPGSGVAAWGLPAGFCGCEGEEAEGTERVMVAID